MVAGRWQRRGWVADIIVYASSCLLLRVHRLLPGPSSIVERPRDSTRRWWKSAGEWCSASTTLSYLSLPIRSRWPNASRKDTHYLQARGRWRGGGSATCPAGLMLGRSSFLPFSWPDQEHTPFPPFLSCERPNIGPRGELKNSKDFKEEDLA